MFSKINIQNWNPYGDIGQASDLEEKNSTVNFELDEKVEKEILNFIFNALSSLDLQERNKAIEHLKKDSSDFTLAKLKERLYDKRGFDYDLIIKILSEHSSEKGRDVLVSFILNPSEKTNKDDFSSLFEKDFRSDNLLKERAETAITVLAKLNTKESVTSLIKITLNIDLGNDFPERFKKYFSSFNTKYFVQKVLFDEIFDSEEKFQTLSKEKFEWINRYFKEQDFLSKLGNEEHLKLVNFSLLVAEEPPFKTENYPQLSLAVQILSEIYHDHTFWYHILLKENNEVCKIAESKINIQKLTSSNSLEVLRGERISDEFKRRVAILRFRNGDPEKLNTISKTYFLENNFDEFKDILLQREVEYPFWKKLLSLDNSFLSPIAEKKIELETLDIKELFSLLDIKNISDKFEDQISEIIKRRGAVEDKIKLAKKTDDDFKEKCYLFCVASLSLDF